MSIKFCTSSLWLYSLIGISILIISESVETRGDDYQDSLGHLQLRTAPKVQKDAAESLILRLLGKDAIFFEVNVDQSVGPNGKDTFKLKKVSSDKIQITGTSGVAVAWGLHYYLKKYCNCHISWEGSQLKLPKILPDVDESVISNDRFRYYQNVCTAGYSSVWWQWDQWEKNIDWMALNGFNLALAFNAQEAIWEKVYLKFNLTKQEIDKHFAGPAFLPWSRMGNFRGWGGPLSQYWHSHTIKLQHSILKRMRELGIIPVLPAFSGHVPRDFVRVFPNAKVSEFSRWMNFPKEYCCPYTLDPTDPLFQTVGQEFLKTYIDEFGTNNIYNCDTFNEITPHKADPAYINEIGKSIYLAMKSTDPDAVWLMQGWLFVNNPSFWTEKLVKALVTSVPLGKMIILDLMSEKYPQYEKFNSYYGQPFIWCMLHNFGGTLGMFGSSEIINKRVFEAREMSNSTMIGTGLTMEGINQNYVIYELMNEMAYRKQSVNSSEWFADYAARRYGVVDASIQYAWQLLGDSIYNHKDGPEIRGYCVVTQRPSLDFGTWYWYDLKMFFEAWKNFANAKIPNVQMNELFKHDLVDITRQALQVTADFLYLDIKKTSKQNNLVLLQSASKRFLDLLDDLNAILASSQDFLLGTWLESAKSLAPEDDAKERDNYEFNARNQITLWGPNGEIVDYAIKQWSGVVSDYFKPRWAIFLEELEKSVKDHKILNLAKIRKTIFNEVELPFSYSKKIYPVKAEGDSIEIANKLFNKWQDVWTSNI